MEPARCRLLVALSHVVAAVVQYAVCASFSSSLLAFSKPPGSVGQLVGYLAV